jgi:hypothetical protein
MQVLLYQINSSNGSVEAADWGNGCDFMDAYAIKLEPRPIIITFFPD